MAGNVSVPSRGSSGVALDTPLLTTAADPNLSNETVVSTVSPLSKLLGGSGVSAANNAALLAGIGASPVAGSSSISTVGTITSGTWNGSAVPVANGGTGTATGNQAALVVTTNTTLNANCASVISCQGTGVTYTVTLPQASACSGKTITFINSGSGLMVQAAAHSGDVINYGSNTALVTPNAEGTSRTFYCDGVRWVCGPATSYLGYTAGGVMTPSEGYRMTSTGAGTAGQTLISAGSSEPVWSTVLNNSSGVSLPTAGQGLLIKEGTNCTVGTSVLVGGTVTVNNTKITTSSILFLTRQVVGGTIGELSKGTVVAATSFVINSDNAGDTSTIGWMIVEPIA